jgi:FHA domain-containing protein
MILVIRAHTLKNETLSQSITGHFDERGGTIGRSDTNTLALPDPERHISRLQAEVWFSNGSFSIRNVGSANAIVINGRPINAGEGTTLGHADELVIGGYVMRATLAAPESAPRTDERAPIDSRTVIKASAVESRTNPRMQLSPPMPPAPPTPRPLGGTTAAMPPPAQPTPPRATPAPIDSANPFGDLLGGPSGPGASDPFADLMGGARESSPTGTMPSFRPAAAPVVAPPPPAARAAFAPPPPPATASRLPDDFDPFADLPSPSSGSASADPLAGFMGSSASAPPPAPSGGSLPVDFSLGDLLGSPTAAPSSSLDAMFGLGGAPAAGSGGDPLAAFLAAPAPGGASANTDPLAMFGGAAPAAPAAGIPADFDHTPELRGAYVPPAVQSPPPAPPPARPLPPPPPPAPVAPPPFDPNMTQVSAPRPPAPPRAAPPAARIRGDDLTPTTTMPGVRPARPSLMTSAPMPLTPMPPTPVTSPVAVQPPPAVRPPAPAAPAYAAGDTTPEALWAAFCEGAGIHLQPPQGLNPALMKVIGEVLRHSVDGTLKLVATRAAAKQELRADVTMIQARNNNPLKFSPDAGAAIEQLLQPPMRGFMVGPAAVHDAMDDLLGHAIGTMVGMRAALEGVLKRFEPSQLEGKLSGNSVLDSVLPMNRRAKLWELYLQHYQRIHDDAQEDFHELFGKAFIKAYEDQLDRLDAERHPGGT